MSKRDEIRSRWWAGGEIAGVRFYPLNIDRMEILRKVGEEVVDGLEMARVAMAVYTMDDEEAADFRGWGSRGDLAEREAACGRYPLEVLEKFQPRFQGDMDAITASLVQPAGEGAAEPEGK